VDSFAPRRLKVAGFVNVTLNSQVQQKTNILRVWTTVRFSRGTWPCGPSLGVYYSTDHTYSVWHNTGLIL